MTKEINISPSDEDMLQKYRSSGDGRIIGELFNQYMHLVYGLCLKYLKHREASQDAVMDIYEAISEKLLTLEVKHFKSWLYIVSKNHCLMILRKKNPEVNNAELLMESPDMVHLKEEKLELETNLVALEDCIEKLSSEQQRCVKLFFIEKKSYHQITEKTGVDLKKVKSHIQNGKRNLKICLESKHAERR